MLCITYRTLRSAVQAFPAPGRRMSNSSIAAPLGALGPPHRSRHNGAIGCFSRSAHYGAPLPDPCLSPGADPPFGPASGVRVWGVFGALRLRSAARSHLFLFLTNYQSAVIEGFFLPSQCGPWLAVREAPNADVGPAAPQDPAPRDDWVPPRGLQPGMSWTRGVGAGRRPGAVMFTRGRVCSMSWQRSRAEGGV